MIASEYRQHCDGLHGCVWENSLHDHTQNSSVSTVFFGLSSGADVDSGVNSGARGNTGADSVAEADTGADSKKKNI